MIHNSCLSAQIQKCVNIDKTETLVTIGDMTYVREVTKLTCIVVYIQFDSICVFSEFV